MDTQTLLQKNIKSTVRCLMLLISIFLLCFFFWAYFAEFSEKTITQGVVNTSSAIKVVQHYEGGIIDKVLVTEGEIVNVGQEIARLQSEQAISAQQKIQAQLLALKIQLEGASAFMEKRQPNFSTFEGYQALKANELKVFNFREKQLKSKIKVINEQVQQNKVLSQSFEKQLESLKKQYQYNQHEVDMREEVFLSGSGSKLMLIKAKAALESVGAEQQKVLGQISVTQKKLDELYQKREDVYMLEARNVADKASKILSEIEEISKVSDGHNDRVSRLVIRSPIHGIIQSLPIKSSGVIEQGGVVSEIVPIDDELIIEIKIPTKSIGFLHPGQEVLVKLQAYDFSRYGIVRGNLVYISPNSFIDKDTALPYYKGRVTLEKNYVGNNNRQNLIIPGMVAEADIITGKKTLFEYLMKPFYANNNLAFTEK